MDNAQKEAEILIKLDFLNEKVKELKDRLSPISIFVPEVCEKNPTEAKSQVMLKIMNITEAVDEILKRIDIF